MECMFYKEKMYVDLNNREKQDCLKVWNAL